MNQVLYREGGVCVSAHTKGSLLERRGPMRKVRIRQDGKVSHLYQGGGMSNPESLESPFEYVSKGMLAIGAFRVPGVDKSVGIILAPGGERISVGVEPGRLDRFRHEQWH
eukprot:scaffold145542_cov46-Attheya_sp.AAC.1